MRKVTAKPVRVGEAEGWMHSQDPMPRLRRRKALPEKLPPMMSPIKSLFGRRTNAGLMLGLPGHQATTGGLPGVCFPGVWRVVL